MVSPSKPEVPAPKPDQPPQKQIENQQPPQKQPEISRPQIDAGMDGVIDKFREAYIGDLNRSRLDQDHGQYAFLIPS